MAYFKHCPYKYKYQLVNWASKRFDRSKSYYQKMSKIQLYAIYYNGQQTAEQIIYFLSPE